jgi:hypothetical protein
MNKLSRWVLAFADLRDHVGSVTCPNCGGRTLRYCVDGEPGAIGYGAVWCQECGKGTWVSRLEVREGNIQCSSIEPPVFQPIDG